MATEIFLSETDVLKRKKQAVWLIGTGFAFLTFISSIVYRMMTWDLYLNLYLGTILNTVLTVLFAVFLLGGVSRLKPLLNKVTQSFFNRLIFFACVLFFDAIIAFFQNYMEVMYLGGGMPENLRMLFKIIFVLICFISMIAVASGCAVVQNNYGQQGAFAAVLYGCIIWMMRYILSAPVNSVLTNSIVSFSYYLILNILLFFLFFTGVKNFINSDFVGVEASQDTFGRIDKGYLSAPVIGLVVCTGLAFLSIYLINHFQPSIQ